VRKIADGLHRDTDNTTYTTTEGAKYLLFCGTAVTVAKSADGWVEREMDKTRSQGSDSFLSTLQYYVKIDKLDTTAFRDYLYKYYSNAKRGFDRLIKLFRSEEKTTELNKLSGDTKQFVAGVQQGLTNYLPGTQSSSILAAQIEAARLAGKQNFYANIKARLPSQTKEREMLYSYTTQDIHYSLDDKATFLDSLEPGARIHFRIGLTDESTDVEYLKLDNGTWQAVERTNFKVKFPSHFRLATATFVFAPDGGSGNAYADQLTGVADIIYVGFDASARIVNNVLDSDNAVQGLAEAYNLIYDVYEALKEIIPDLKLPELACRATVGCNTISLLHDQAVKLSKLGDGANNFFLTLDSIKAYINANITKRIIVLGTDAFMEYVWNDKEYHFPTYEVLFPRAPADIEIFNIRSLVQEIIWRQKAMDKVYIPESILDPNNDQHIEYINHRHALVKAVRQLVNDLQSKGDLQVILACTELPDAFATAARFDPVVASYIANYSPIDPAKLVNQELMRTRLDNIRKALNLSRRYKEAMGIDPSLDFSNEQTHDLGQTQYYSKGK